MLASNSNTSDNIQTMKKISFFPEFLIKMYIRLLGKGESFVYTCRERLIRSHSLARSVADLGGRIRRAPPPTVQNFLDFMQFFEKI